jgi:hypothetical protein
MYIIYIYIYICTSMHTDICFCLSLSPFANTLIHTWTCDIWKGKHEGGKQEGDGMEEERKREKEREREFTEKNNGMEGEKLPLAFGGGRESSRNRCN